MALSATVTLNPPTLTVVSDRRKVHVTITSAGDTASADGLYPIVVTDAARTWVVKSDDGLTAVFTA